MLWNTRRIWRDTRRKIEAMLTTTLNRIRAHSPCEKGWKKLLAHLGKTQADDEPLPYSVIVESNGLEDALWCCRVEPQYDREWRLFAVWCARQVQHLITDKRSLHALDVAERFANGQATIAELDAAWEAAREAAWEASWAAPWEAALEAAREAAREAAWEAAWAAPWEAARAAPWDSDRAAARDSTRGAQTARFLEICK